MSETFGGVTFNEDRDGERLRAQLARVRAVMWDAQWRTLAEIAAITGDPEASISARLRDFRKRQFGEHTMNARTRGPEELGLWEYQVIPNTEGVSAMTENTPRRRLTTEERLARLDSQRAMIEKRAHDKQRERAAEALLLIAEIEGLASAGKIISDWLTKERA